jgi:TetR/AcrR family transcriptional repressor of mexJK operon
VLGWSGLEDLPCEGLTVKTEPFSLDPMASTPPAPVQTERTSPKRKAILAGAREVFSEVGYERACVDVIAARACVSKATVYSHFADKSALFLATFADETDEMRAAFIACVDGDVSGSIEERLQSIGEKLMALILSPGMVSLYRHTSTECARFPAVGQMLYDRGAGVVYPALAAHLDKWQERGALALDDSHAAAIQFAMLCQGDLWFRALIGILPQPADQLIYQNVTNAVRVFVRAYAPPKSKRR